MEIKKTNWKNYLGKASKILNTGWKLALVVIGLFAAVLVISAIWEHINDHCGRGSHYWDRDLSRNICVHCFPSGNVRVYDLNSRKYITPRLKWVAGVPERDSLTVFCAKDGKRGFINVNTGEIVIEGKYEHAWVFSEGLAAVVEPGGSMGFIDGTGEYIIAPELDYIPSHDYVFKHGVCCIGNREGKQGLLTREGEWALPQEYTFIGYAEKADMFIPELDGKDGLVRNGSFEWVCQLEYDDIMWVDSPSGDGFVLYKDYTMKHVSVDGGIIDRFLIDDVRELKYMTEYHSCEADEYAVSDKVISFKVRGLWGIMDKQTGKVIVPAMFGDVELASESLIQCYINNCGYGECVLYNLSGNKIE